MERVGELFSRIPLQTFFSASLPSQKTSCDHLFSAPTIPASRSLTWLRGLEGRHRPDGSLRLSRNG